MSNPNTEPMAKLARLVMNMNRTWESAGGLSPRLEQMDGDMTALDLLIIMAANGIEFKLRERDKA